MKERSVFQGSERRLINVHLEEKEAILNMKKISFRNVEVQLKWSVPNFAPVEKKGDEHGLRFFCDFLCQPLFFFT